MFSYIPLKWEIFLSCSSFICHIFAKSSHGGVSFDFDRSMCFLQYISYVPFALLMISSYIHKYMGLAHMVKILISRNDDYKVHPLLVAIFVCLEVIASVDQSVTDSPILFLTSSQLENAVNQFLGEMSSALEISLSLKIVSAECLCF